MNLKAEILKEHSKAQCRKIVQWVGRDQKRFDQLFGLFLHDEGRVVQRAAWPVSYCVEAHPPLIKKHWAALVSYLHKPNLHDAVKRNSIRLMQHIEIPEQYHGEVMNRCFTYLELPGEPVAVKVFSMSVLARLAKTYPEIKDELVLMIKDQLPHQSAGFKSRAKKVLKQLERS